MLPRVIGGGRVCRGLRFKRVARYVVESDISPEQQDWFKVEKRQRLRRLMACGVLGHHPGIQAWCHMQEAERRGLESTICRQRAAMTAKALGEIEQVKRNA